MGGTFSSFTEIRWVYFHPFPTTRISESVTYFFKQLRPGAFSVVWLRFVSTLVIPTVYSSKLDPIELTGTWVEQTMFDIEYRESTCTWANEKYCKYIYSNIKYIPRIEVLQAMKDMVLEVG